MIDHGPGDCFTAARAWHGWLGKARRPKVLLAWPVRQGSAREGVVWIGRSGTVRLARKGRHGFARHGLFRYGWLGVAGIAQGTAMQARQGPESHKQARQARHGVARSGAAGEAAMDGPGSDWQAWRVPAWFCSALQARRGEVRRVRGTAWHGRHG